MQGSRQDKGIHAQSYRTYLRDLIRRHVPEAEVICPWELNPESVNYSDEQARRCFFDMAQQAAECDVLVAYVPEASMGSAVEMWRAFEAGKTVLTISPMSENWVIRFLSHRVFATLEDFACFVADGGLTALDKQAATG